MSKNKKKKATGSRQQELSPVKYIQTKARNLPVKECLIDKNWKETGLTYVIVARQHVSGRYTMGYYLVDTFCRGVKDTFFHFNMEESEYKELKRNMENRMESMLEASYNEAHNIIYGAIAWAEEYGFHPHPEFKTTQYLLEEDTDDIPLIEYEFGKDGKPCLVVRNTFEASCYLPTLQKNAGDDYTMDILDKGDYEDADDDESMMLDDQEKLGLSFMEATLKKLTKIQEEYRKMPKVLYTYQYPAYPQKLVLNHPEETRSLFEVKYNYHLPEDCIDTILDLPRETLIADLKQIILYEIGRTYDKIENEEWEEEYSAILSHALFFIAGLKIEECLDEVLELLRQSFCFFDYNFADNGEFIVLPALYEAGHNKLQQLATFIEEPGLDTMSKSYVFYMVAQIPVHEPERREEVIGWFRSQIDFCIAHGEDLTVYDGGLGAGLCSALIDMSADELLPDIKRLYDACQIDMLMNGGYDKVKGYILSDREPSFIIDRRNVYEIYKKYAGFYRE